MGAGAGGSSRQASSKTLTAKAESIFGPGCRLSLMAETKIMADLSNPLVFSEFMKLWTLDKLDVEQSSDLHFNKICGIIGTL